MFVIALKNPLKSKKKLLFAALAVILAAAVIFAAVFRSGTGYAESESLGRYSVKVSNNKELDSFLSVFGLSGTPSSKSEVTVPTKFNKTYEKYNSLQKQVGMDLMNYRGRTAEKYIVDDEKDKISITLLIYDCRVIGGHFQKDGGSKIYSLDGEKWNG